jgi:hypothetical protein
VDTIVDDDDDTDFSFQQNSVLGALNNEASVFEVAFNGRGM